MLTVIHLELERLGVHQAPKHLAEWDIGILIASAWIYDLLAGTDGEMMASHLIFSVLSTSPLWVAKELTEEIWARQSVRLVESVRMSSACDRAPRKRPLMLRPLDLDCNYRRMGSITRRNSTGESTEPWRTPRWIWNCDDTLPQTRADDVGFVYHCLMRRQAFPVTPALLRLGTPQSRRLRLDRKNKSTHGHPHELALWWLLGRQKWLQNRIHPFGRQSELGGEYWDQRSWVGFDPVGQTQKTLQGQRWGWFLCSCQWKGDVCLFLCGVV